MCKPQGRIPLTYKNRLVILVTIITLLALTYTASHIFSPERRNNRTASYVWLDSKLAAGINRIVIDTEFQNIELMASNNRWFVSHNGELYPARRARIEDFTAIFTKRSLWPVRSAAASSHERFGLDGEKSSRVTIYGENSVLLDLLFGDIDNTGREIYIRKAGNDEVRSGDSSISSYISTDVNSWYNLRLLPESENGKLDIDSVQRLTVYNEGETLTFSRSGRNWVISGINVENPDYSAIENYIRTVLNIEGDNFIDSVYSNDPFLNRIVFEFGDGRVVTVSISAPNEENRRYAIVSTSEYVYSIPSWTTARIFRDTASFERQ
jgi:hypothetical protein